MERYAKQDRSSLAAVCDMASQRASEFDALERQSIKVWNIRCINRPGLGLLERRPVEKFQKHRLQKTCNYKVKVQRAILANSVARICLYAGFIVDEHLRKAVATSHEGDRASADNKPA